MPRPGIKKKPLYARLTRSEIDILKQEKLRSRSSSVSVVLERAVHKLLTNPRLAEEGLQLPVATTDILPRTYQISEQTIALVDEAGAKFGYSMRDILRAAVGQLSRAAARPPAKAG